MDVVVVIDIIHSNYVGTEFAYEKKYRFFMVRVSSLQMLMT